MDIPFYMVLNLELYSDGYYSNILRTIGLFDRNTYSYSTTYKDACGHLRKLSHAKQNQSLTK